MTKTDWNPVLRAELAKPYWEPLQKFVADERAHYTVYPPANEVFSALYLTPFADVKVLILGQDPYHGPRQAHGLCFSVQPGIERPPSLANIFKELRDDLGLQPPNHGCLEGWADRRAGLTASRQRDVGVDASAFELAERCLLYTSPSPRDS